MTQRPAVDQGRPSTPRRGGRATREPPIPLEEWQPDPLRQMTTGRTGGGGLTLVAVAVAIILGVVFWGLNSPRTVEHKAGVAPAAQSKAPPAGGNSGATTPGAAHTTRSGSG